MRVKESVREALKSALDGCEMDRETVAREISRLVGEEVSVHSLNNWCAEGKSDRRIPLEYAAAVVAITGNRGVLDAALGVIGYRVLAPEEEDVLELGRITLEERSRRKAKRRVLERLRVGDE